MQLGVAKRQIDTVVVADFAKRGAVKRVAFSAGQAGKAATKLFNGGPRFHHFRTCCSAFDSRTSNARIHSVTEDFKKQAPHETLNKARQCLGRIAFVAVVNPGGQVRQ